MMKFKVLLLTLLFALGMWAQTAAPKSEAKPGASQPKAACCDNEKCCKSAQTKDAKSCCKDGECPMMAKSDAGKAEKSCCGGKMCMRHKAVKS